MAPLLNYTAAADSQGVCDQWQQLTGKSGFCIFCLQAAGITKVFLYLHRYCYCIFAYIAHPSCACCMWPAWLCRRVSGDPSAGWPALTPADLPRLHLTLWPAETNYVLDFLFSCSDLSSKAPSVNGIIYTTFNKQTFTHSCSELLLCTKLKSPGNMTKSFYFRQILFFTQSLSASEWTWNQFTVKGAICCVIMHYIIW